MNRIETKEQLQQLQSELPNEYFAKLTNWWCRAQKPDKPYLIEYDSVEDLCKKVDEHLKKAKKRAEQRKQREGRAERQQRQSESEQCADVICKLAQVRGLTVKEAINALRVQISDEQAAERERVERAAQAKQAEIDKFVSEHPDFERFEQLLSERQQLRERQSKLSVSVSVSESKTKRGRKTAEQLNVLF